VPQPLHRKIVSPAELAEIRQNLRTAGRTVVQCHGCFDVVHPGHIRYLQFARQLGDVLIVSLTGDAAVAKGPDRPYISQELRAENLAVLEFVDWVVIDPHPTACEILQLLKPDVYVKGREYARAADARFRGEREIVEGYGGKVTFHSGDTVFSSTQLIESMRDDQRLDQQRLETFCSRNRMDGEKMRTVLAGFAGARAVVVGDLIRERYVFCDVGATADDAPVLNASRLAAAEYWGGAACVALQLRALGAAPVLVTAAGSQTAADEYGGILAEQGVQTCLLPDRCGSAERTTFIADDSKLFQVTEGSNAPLDSKAEKRAVRLLNDQLRRNDMLIWCDYGFGLLTPGLLAAGCQAARALGRFTAGSAAGQRGQLLPLRETSLLTGSERQVREALHDMASSLPAVVSNLLQMTSGQAAVVSLRKRGLIGFDSLRVAKPDPAANDETTQNWHDRLRSEFVPTFARHPVDMLGSAESVLVAAALVLAGGGSLPLATYVASAAESLAVSYSGGRPPNAGALLEFFEGRPELQVESRFLADPPWLAEPARRHSCAVPG
jgi:rfaE bifunctional protein nucleotidyltransferase chain/domain